MDYKNCKKIKLIKYYTYEILKNLIDIKMLPNINL